MAPRKQYTKRRQFTIGLDEEELEGLREIANRQGLSMADVVRGMVCLLIENTNRRKRRSKMAEDELTIESIKAQLAAVEKRVREKREKVAAGTADEPEKSQERLQAEGTVKLLTTKLQNLERSVEVAMGEEAPVESVLDWYSAKISETKEELEEAQKLLDDLVVAEEHAATNDRGGARTHDLRINSTKSGDIYLSPPSSPSLM